MEGPWRGEHPESHPRAPFPSPHQRPMRPVSSDVPRGPQVLRYPFILWTVDSCMYAFIHSYNKVVTECLVSTRPWARGNMGVNRAAAASVLTESTSDRRENKSTVTKKQRSHSAQV